MNEFTGKIGVIGAGALGGFYGGRLARAGADVHLLLRGDYDAARARGLIIHSVDGDFTVHAPVYRTAAELGRCDLLLIGLKTTHNDALPALLAPTAGPETIILTLQNGLGSEEQIAAALRSLGHANPETRIIGGTAFICASRGAPGVIEHTAHGWVRIAEFCGIPTARTHALAALFARAGVRCEVCDSLARIRWEKLIWNIPFSGLGVAARRADTGAIMADDELLATIRGLMEEVIAGARADGVELDPALIDARIDDTRCMGAYRSSMQLDAELGRPLEVEAIIGEPLRRTRRAGIPTPRLQMLYGIVRRLDRVDRLDRAGRLDQAGSLKEAL